MNDSSAELARIHERLARSRAELAALRDSQGRSLNGADLGDDSEFPRSATLRFLRHAPAHPVITTFALGAAAMLASRFGLVRIGKIIGIISLLRRARTARS